MTVTVHSLVGEVVKERFSRARVFERYGIDYCCGGKVPLAEACRGRGVEPEAVLAEIERSDLDFGPGDDLAADVNGMSLTALADHIEEVHHSYLRQEMPRIELLAAKVVEVHGQSDQRLKDIPGLVRKLENEIGDHLAKEEQILFPMIRRLEGEEGIPAFHCGSIANPIRQMEFEHDDAGRVLDTLRDLTDGYRPPEWACNTYVALLEGLAGLESDLHLHIHKENNVLFPGAIRMEEAKTAGLNRRS